MIPESLRKRIAALNRGRLRTRGPSDPVAVAPAQPAHPRRLPSGGPFQAGLEDVLPDLEEATLPGGTCGLLDRRLGDLIPKGADTFEENYRACLRTFRVPDDADRSAERLRALSGVPPESLLYVDIEATGFTSATPLFLVGTLVLEAGAGFRLRQYLARTYGEEGVVLSFFTEQLEKADVVVSFNGKRYDLPYLGERAVYHAVPFPFTQPHIDLLHESRARFRHRLPNCKLQTLEQRLCGLCAGDIPGMEIPDAYHRFVRTGNALEIRDVIHHNALDLVTLAEVMVHVLREPSP